jgi:hypothetical protein
MEGRVNAHHIRKGALHPNGEYGRKSSRGWDKEEADEDSRLDREYDGKAVEGEV